MDEPTETDSPTADSVAVKKKQTLRFVLLGVGLLLIILVVIFHDSLGSAMIRGWQFVSSRDEIKAFIERFGVLAPFIFFVVQFLQVVFAPIPGEATGFLGGYLFGVLKGFIISTIALSLGSLVNFYIGRLLGERYIRKLISPEKLERFDTFVKHQGVLVLLIFFVFPGFPKDYLCLFLGATALPFKAFLLIAAFGRMPGTLMLSLQGASLFEGNYVVLGILAGGCLILALIIYRFRREIYSRVDKMNKRN